MGEGETTSPTPPASDAAATAIKPSRAHRLIHIAVALLVAVVLPVGLVGLLVGSLGVWGMLIGLVLGFVGAKLGGTHRMAFAAPAVGLAGGLGAATAYDWWWAALLAATGIIAGVGIRFGWFVPLLMIPYAATFVVQVSSTEDAVIYGIFVGIGTLYAVALARRFGLPAVVDGDHLSVGVSAVVAVMFGAVLGGAAAIGVGLGWTEPYWVPEPILILVLYLIMGRRDRLRGKAIGTALGVAAAIPVALLDPPPEVLTVVGAAVFVLALTRTKTYWQMYGLYTFSLVLLLSAPGQVGYEAEERGVQILAGTALLFVGLVVVHALAGWLARHHPQPELGSTAEL
jgi:hypothetical protein